MCVRVADQVIEYCPVNQGQQIAAGADTGAAQQIEASGKRRPSLGFIFELGGDTKCLAEVLLVQAPGFTPGDYPVIALHHEDPNIAVRVNEASGRIESHLAGQCHAERFVLHAAVQPTRQWRA